MEVEKQKGLPCQPWDLPWPATATPPLGKSQLSLATSCLPKVSFPLFLPLSSSPLFNSVFFCF